MNEGQKTGLFCIVGAVVLALGLFLSWPTAEREDSSVAAGKPLFETFKDPLAATSLKMVSFNEEQGQVETFEVRRDRESGVWTIPSRKGYPADAVEQMKNAANSLVGLSILDVQTRNAEDHEALGVVEPKLEKLEVGDVGVGRLVTFRDEAQKDLASLIIGNPVKDEEGKIYVRKPGQDPVYVVKLDESALSTRFQDWIEEDLLNLSSIDIQEMTIKDYAASMSQRGIALTRNYTAKVELDGSEWKLGELLEYASDDPMAEPKIVETDPTQTLNTEKLNDIKNALDDLKIVDVVRKPEGMSDNLRADKDLISDREAVTSLASRGFFPVSMGANGQFEVLSANGELNVTINNGVQYVLRFGNVSGLSDAKEIGSDDESAGSTGVNRYLLVTTRIAEEQFPAPELRPVPQTIEELAGMLGVEATSQDQPTKEMKNADDSAKPEPETKSEPEKNSEPETKAEPNADPQMKADSEEKAEPVETKKPDQPETTDEPKKAVEEVEVSGEGEATGTGQGADQSVTDDEPQSEPEINSDELPFAELGADEKQERLEAEQEKILKENTRMLDARKDRLNAAKRRVRDLNARFADWYYVIPEATYRELRIQRDELMTTAESAGPNGKSSVPTLPDGLMPPGLTD